MTNSPSTSILPIAETERLIIRPLSNQDLPALAEMLADPKVMEFSVNGVMTQKASQEFIDWCKSLYVERGYGSWALQDRQTSDFVGFAGLTSDEQDGHKAVDVGYRLARKYWGQGLATEATHAVLHYGFRTLGLQSIFCVVLPEHEGSIRVAEKIGFSQFEMVETNGAKVRMYQMTSDEWGKQSLER